MPPVSPQINPMASSPRNSIGGRPSVSKRHSSQSSHMSKNHVTSPGSAGDQHPLRHAVGARQRHAKIVLPRNHSSGRNLVKLGKQAQQNHVRVAEDENERMHLRQRSHEGDTEIRLPGSLDDDKHAPPMRRNLTAYQLPRDTSHTKLKKNLSHGQLTRLQSGKNLVGLNSGAMKAPSSPGLKGRTKRPKSAEIHRDLHEQEMELYRQQEEEKKKEATVPKVGFAVGSAGDTSGDGGEDVPNMEGSGLQDDEWTDQSASASPYSTRQNTANSSRRTSMAQGKALDRAQHALNPVHPSVNFRMSDVRQHRTATNEALDEGPEAEADGTPAQSEADQDDSPSPRSKPSSKKSSIVETLEPTKQPVQPITSQRSPLHAAKDHPMNSATKRLLERNYQLPAPALVSNVSAMDNVHSARGSPAPSMHSSRSNIGEGNADPDQGELVSRFIPSASHPSTGSGRITTINTPKQGSFQTPEEESTLHRARFQVGGPLSPGSTVSGSSGAATPGLGRSRIELRMLQEKALADREAVAERQPLVPHHIYDRRNETLKSYLNLAAVGAEGHATTGLSLGPEIFQGRFKAVNTELKVVQKFRDPIAESVSRLRQCRGTKLGHQIPHPKQQAAALKLSKSAVSLPGRPGAVREPSKLSTSASPPRTAQVELSKSTSPQKLSSSKPTQHTKSTVQVRGSGDVRRPRREVSFAGTPPETREYERSNEELGPDAIARQMWESVGA